MFSSLNTSQLEPSEKMTNDQILMGTSLETASATTSTCELKHPRGVRPQCGGRSDGAVDVHGQERDGCEEEEGEVLGRRISNEQPREREEYLNFTLTIRGHEYDVRFIKYANRRVYWSSTTIAEVADYAPSTILKQSNLKYKTMRVLIDYLQYREGEWIAYDVLDRFGFFDVEHNNSKPWKKMTANERSLVQRYQIVRLRFDKLRNRYMGSDKEKGIGGWFPIFFYSLEIHSAIDEELRTPIDLGEEVTVKEIDGRLVVRLNSTENSKWRKLMQLDMELSKRSGRVVRLNLPGASGIEKIGAHLKLSRQVMAFGKEGRCAQFSVINAVSTFQSCSKESIQKLISCMPPALPDFGQAHEWLTKALGYYHLTKAEIPTLWDLDDWVDEKRGKPLVLLMRMKGATDEMDDVDHCIAIDASNSEILDPSCEQRLKFTHEALITYVNNLQYIEDVRIVVEQKRALKRKRKNRRSNRTKMMKRVNALVERQLEEESAFDRLKFSRRVVDTDSESE